MPLQRNPALVRLLVALFLSVIGDGAYFVAMAWWLKTTTGSDAQIGLLALGESVAAIACGPVGGVLADRWDRRRLMIGCDLVRAALLAAPLALLAAHRLEPWHVIATGVCLTGIGTAFGPALNAALPALVARDALTAANSSSQICFALGAVVGPAIGGVLVGAGGSTIAVAANLASFLVSAALLTTCPIPHNAPAPHERPNLWAEMTGGLRFFLGAPTLLGMLLLGAVLNFVVAPLSILLPAIAHDVVRTDSRGFGILQAMIPAGLVAGGIVAPSLRIRRTGPAVLGFCACSGVAFALFGAARTLPPAAGLLAVMGALFSLTNLTAVVAFQTRIPSEVQGRAFAAMGTLSQALRPAGIAVGAAAVLKMGPSAVAVGAGMLLALGSLGGALVPGLLALRADSD